jgi:hypothetical protein
LPAIYREWLIDPDGNELPPTKDWLPDREEPPLMPVKILRRSLRARRFEPLTAPASLIDIDEAFLRHGRR